jgi:hypothetical protein
VAWSAARVLRGGAQGGQVHPPHATPALPWQAVVIVGRWHGWRAAAVEQDEVIEDDLDAGMAFAGVGILPS